ncbi:MAG: methenyltetrahydrofolate cyclohydrolase [Methylococcaceae bacterium]
MTNDANIEQFLDALASTSPTPGGGSVAAIMGAMGAALVSMVCHLTLGKPAYAAVENEMQQILGEAETLRAQLTGMVQADVAVFDQVMAAYRLPKDTEIDKQQRSAAIQTALKAATEVPLSCARLCVSVMVLSRQVAGQGNQGVVTDAGVAVVAAYAALRSSELNVRVNAKNIRDETFASTRLNELDRLLEQAQTLETEVFGTVLARL